MITLSCAEYTFPLLPPRDRLAMLRLLGFEYVDLGLFERDVALAPSRMMDNPGTFAAQLLHDLDRAQLQVSDVFLQVGVSPHDAESNTCDGRVRARSRVVFRRTLELCQQIRSEHLTGLPGVWHGDTSRECDLDRAADEAAWRLETARVAGISYAVEPHIDSICTTVEETQRFLALVPGLTLTLDYGHFVACGIASEAVHALLPHASHLHARGGAPQQLQTTVDENAIDFDGIIARLLMQGYEGSVALEYVWTSWQGCNRTDNVSETLRLREQLSALLDAQQSP